MDIISEVHKNFLLDLVDFKVEFMLIGGYAVIYHGYARLTTDMDIWIKPNNEENKTRLINVLRKAGINEIDLIRVQNLDFTEAHAFHIGQDQNRIDFLTKLTGIKYDEADREKVFLELQNHRVPVIHFHSLVVNKMLSDRLKDKADVEELQKIQKFKKKK